VGDEKISKKCALSLVNPVEILRLEDYTKQK